MKLFNMYENPNMSQALMAEWAEVRQLEGEDLTTFMTRNQDLVDRAFLDYSDTHKQQLAVQAFCRGMQNLHMAELVALHARDNVNAALQAVGRLLSVPGQARGSAEPSLARSYKSTNSKYQSYAAGDTSQHEDDYYEEEQYYDAEGYANAEDETAECDYDELE